MRVWSRIRHPGYLMESKQWHSMPSLFRYKQICLTSNYHSGCVEFLQYQLKIVNFTNCCISFTHMSVTFYSSSAVSEPSCLCCCCTLRFTMKSITGALTESNLLRQLHQLTEVMQCKPIAGQRNSVG